MVLSDPYGRGRNTKRPTDPSDPGDENVVPLFPGRPAEELVPLDRDERGESAAGDEPAAGVWSEARQAALIDPEEPSVTRERHRSRTQVLARLTISAALGAATALLALGALFSQGAPHAAHPRHFVKSYVARAAPSKRARTRGQLGAHKRFETVQQRKSPRRAGRPRPVRHASGHSATGRSETPATPSPQPVSYQPAQSTAESSAQQQPSSQPAAETTPAPTGASAASSGSSQVTSGQSSPPAFGSNGVLGPGSSPDG